jgi:hypothetical protein
MVHAQQETMTTAATAANAPQTAQDARYAVRWRSLISRIGGISTTFDSRADAESFAAQSSQQFPHIVHEVVCVGEEQG